MMLRKYETLFIAKPDLPEDAMEKIRQKVTGALKKHGGVEIAYQDWGKRKLAYQIQKLNKGTYLYLRYLGNGVTVIEIEHQMKVLDDVMRFVTVKLEDRINPESFNAEEDAKTVYPFGARPRSESDSGREFDGGSDRRESGDDAGLGEMTGVDGDSDEDRA